MAGEITPTEQELLSTYLDNQLSAADRARLESRLRDEPALRAELDALRQTVTVLKAAPQLAVPRNFTLDVARFRRPVPWWARYQTMQLMGAVGTLASILLIVAGTLLFSSNAAVPFAPSAAKSSGSVSNGVAVLPTTTAIPLSEATQLPAVNIPATQTALPTTTFVIPTLVPTQAAAVESAETSTAASGKFFAQSGGSAADTGAPPQQAPAIIQPAPTTPTTAPELAQAQAQQPTLRDSTALEDQTLAFSTEKPDANAPSAKVAEPTSTPAPSETATVTALAPTNTSVPSETATAAPTDAYSRQALQPSAPPIILIIGIALLVFSIMLFGIGWLRSRLRG